MILYYLDLFDISPPKKRTERIRININSLYIDILSNGFTYKSVEHFCGFDFRALKGVERYKKPIMKRIMKKLLNETTQK